MRVRRLTYRLAAGLFSAVALQSFAVVFSVQTKVAEVWTRDWGTHPVMDTTTLTTMSAQGFPCSGNYLRSPVTLLTDPNHKTYRDTLLLAYTLKSDVKIFFDTSKPCYNLAFPAIIGVDLVPLP
jgi:hypothetical protein